MRLRHAAPLLLVAALFVLVNGSARAADEVLIPAGSSWRYNDTGSNLGTSWRTPAYSDASWKTGLAQLGYGDGDEITTVSYGPNSTTKYITTYFRRAFTVSNPANFSALTMRVMRDDGCVVYVNGVEVWRSNMPTGTISYTTLAPAAIGGTDESAWHEVPIDPARLVAGSNVIAVEVHQQTPTSTDVSFNLELRGATIAAPAVVVNLVAPSDGGLVNGTSATFSATAAAPAGLATATLLVGGVQQTTTFTGPGQIEDAQITADTPTTPAGAGAAINIDGQAPHAHGLMKFPTLVGAGAGQIPAGSTIASATLQVNCTNIGMTMSLYRLTQDWVEDQATWNQRSTGVAWGNAGADGTASRAGSPQAGACTATGIRSIDLTRFVQEWADGAANFGVVFTDGGTDGVDFDSSESPTPPVLVVSYRTPLVSLGSVNISGTSAPIDFPVTLPALASYSWNVEVRDTAGNVARAPMNFTVIADAAAPDEPVLISPGAGAIDVDPASPLVARLSTPGGGSLTATADIRRASGEPFTIVILPDTQHYSEAFPSIFTNQTQWIVDNKAAHNIIFVSHEGDIVEHAGVTLEWQRANTSMSLLDGVVPYGMAPGNHDIPSTMYNQYFPFTRYQGLPWYGGHYQNLNDNNFQLFTGGGIKFVAVHLEYCPPADRVAWAKSVFDTYPDRIGMMTTHAYLNESAQRTTHGCGSTQYLWDQLGAVTPNLHFMFSGHVHDESRRTDMGAGHPVFQMLADYQGRASGGEGWLRLLRFAPGDDKIYVRTYSPWLNRYETDANSEFTIDFPMSSPISTTAGVTVPSGGDAPFTAPPLDPSTKYEWRVTATNAAGRSRTGPWWAFTTGNGGPMNQAPVATSTTVDLTEDVPMGLTAMASDPEGQPLTYTLVGAPSNGTLIGTLPNVTYVPNLNFSGVDAFTFRVSDGDLTSEVATVALNVASVNDAPTSSGEAYSVVSGNTLTTAAPGVLGNDTDVDGTPLAAVLVSGPANGVLSLSFNGSFTYTPNAGFVGTDSFTYAASDGGLGSAGSTVTITVTAPPPPPPPTPVTVFSASFSSNADGFSYLDNAFRGTSQSSYAEGSYTSGSGFSGGGLRVYVGGVNSNTINNMSGGWRRSFTLAAAGSVTLTFRYRLNQGPDYESDEISQMLASLDGTLVSNTANDYIAQVAGNGNGGSNVDTGWRLVTIELGMRAAGSHTLTLGGFNNRKNSSTERTAIYIDDVTVVVR